MKIDTGKWKLSKLCPRRYAERFELTGAEGKPLVPELPEDQRWLEAGRRIAFVLARADRAVKRAPPAPLQLVHEVKPGKTPAPQDRREPPPRGQSDPDVYEPEDEFDGGAEEHGRRGRRSS